MYPPEFIAALKDTLKNIYWYKKDLRLFLLNLELPDRIVQKQLWDDKEEYKITIVDKILQHLIVSGDNGLGAMRRIVKTILGIENFDYLKGLEDGASKVQCARRSVEKLRELVSKHDASLLESKKMEASIQKSIIKNIDLSIFEKEFAELTKIQNPQKRGFEFERFLCRLFEIHDLNPKGSFKNVGEQLDGGFELESTFYLLEAKWEDNPQNASTLNLFNQKVTGKLDNTLGLLISMSGFSKDAIECFQKGKRTSILLMDGQDISVVLQGLVGLVPLLKRKIRHAQQTGDAYFQSKDMFS